MIAVAASRRRLVGLGGAVVAPLALGVGLASSGSPLYLLAVAALAAVIGVFVVLVQPDWIFTALAFVLGAIPFGVLPGLPLPMVVVLAVGAWAAMLAHPIVPRHVGALEVCVLILMGTSFVSMLANAEGGKDVTQFLLWFLATSLIVPLLSLPRAALRRFGRVFVYGTGAGAVFALGMFFLDKSGSTMNHLSFIGYGTLGTIGTHLRFFDDGAGQVVRLTGTYVDPNVAGIYLFVGLALCIALLRGWSRLLLAPILFVAVVVTLSRSAIFAVVVGVIFFLLFQRMRTDGRLTLVAGAIVATVAALSVPAIATRILDSFGATDKGADDRGAALQDFPESMSGHWVFGKGWGIAEFTDEVAGYQANYVANSPLLTVYRGGVLTGLAFCAVLVVGIVIAYRHARRHGPWEQGVIGAAFVGFVVVALQLDFPVVTHPPITMAFTVFVTFLVANPVSAEDDLTSPPETADRTTTPESRALHG